MKKRLRAVLFGPQGCGKGTQGQLLADRFDVPLIGVGDLFRAEISERSSLGRVAKKYVETGSLAPDDLTNAIVANQMKRLDLARGFVLDGYPRNVEQAIHLDRIAKISLAIHIKISDAEAIRRLTGRLQCRFCHQTYHLTEAPPIKPGVCAVCGRKLVKRTDDTEDLIRNRLANYHFMTEPLAAYYRQRGVLLAINGEQPIPYVFEDIVKKAGKLGFKS
ncbi:nucleoside monophosphate kinase [Candidatus Uhrbacteria bacterium]|nr:nucleoside monophosphate kinase [Candidatus Uhrbacteria bacterium]